MENSVYRGKLLCTYDLKDENGIYYEELVLEWKEAAADRGLRCVDCGAPVYLAAGPVKEPYFAHYDSQECDYGGRQESEELKKGKRLLYQLLKRSFPDYTIQAKYRLENGTYATFYCETGKQRIALDYRLVNNSLEKFRIKDNYYEAHNIKVIYILGHRQEMGSRQLDWYQNLIQNSMGYLAFLDTKKEQLILKRGYGYRLGKERRFKYCIKAYPIRELSMNTAGRIMCDFDDLCSKTEEQLKEEKESYERRLDRLRQLRWEKQRLEQEEQLRMEAYRRQEESRHMDRMDSMLQGDPQVGSPEERPPVTIMNRSDEEILALGLNIALYHKCAAMIEQGDGDLVAEKYYNLITGRSR